MARETNTALTDVIVECQGCDYASRSLNGLGSAARHHDATGHEVRTSVTRLVVYGEGPTPEELGQTTLDDVAGESKVEA